jgi:NADH/F420H2 dehydrogenase subunit C
LPEVLAEFTTDVSADLDEVVCRVASAGVAEVAEILKNDPRVSFKFIRLLTVVDYIEPDGELEVVYHLQSLENRFKMALKTRVKESAPGVPTVTTVWRGADWFEREMHDLFGVVFEGHPDPRTLILPDNFEGYPGRKSYPLHDYDQW